VINGGNNCTLEMYSNMPNLLSCWLRFKKQEDAALFTSLHRYFDMDTRSGVLCGALLSLGPVFKEGRFWASVREIPFPSSISLIMATALPSYNRPNLCNSPGNYRLLNPRLIRQRPYASLSLGHRYCLCIRVVSF
jgi:hypothetical protein